jgi:hypothetical protein
MSSDSGESEVVMSIDGEGNGFFPLCDFCESHYISDSTWSGELWSEEDGDNEPPEDSVPCVVLWPNS